jgi:hypothetical protein
MSLLGMTVKIAAKGIWQSNHRKRRGIHEIRAGDIGGRAEAPALRFCYGFDLVQPGCS